MVALAAVLCDTAHAEPDREGFTLEGHLAVGPLVLAGEFRALLHFETLIVGYRLPIGFEAGVMLRSGRDLESDLGGDSGSGAWLLFAGAELAYHPFSRAVVDPFVALAYGFAHVSGGVRGAFLFWRVGLLGNVTPRMAIGGHVGGGVITWSPRTAASTYETGLDLTYTF